MLKQDQLLEEYILHHTTPETDVLKELNRQTQLKVLYPRMLSGHLQGRVLSMLSKMIQPTTILEIGTYTGYSAICLAEGLTKNGKLYTIDSNDEIVDFTKEYFLKAGISNQVEFLIGKALSIIPELSVLFDLVFIDADKTEYIEYYNHVFDKVRKGGYIIIDNVLWDGKVTETNTDDIETKAIIDFNKMIQNDSRIENVLLPIRDGLMICRKKS